MAQMSLMSHSYTPATVNSSRRRGMVTRRWAVACMPPLTLSGKTITTFEPGPTRSRRGGEPSGSARARRVASTGSFKGFGSTKVSAGGVITALSGTSISIAESPYSMRSCFIRPSSLHGSLEMSPAKALEGGRPASLLDATERSQHNEHDSCAEPHACLYQLVPFINSLLATSPWPPPRWQVSGQAREPNGPRAPLVGHCFLPVPLFGSRLCPLVRFGRYRPSLWP